MMYLNDMIHCAELALSFATGLKDKSFTPNHMAYEAIVRQLELIGEAAGHIPTDVQSQAMEIPWRDMMALRNRLAHAYFAVETEILWNLIQEELPLTLERLIRLRKELLPGGHHG